FNCCGAQVSGYNGANLQGERPRMEIKDKVAVVTGGASGIGRAVGAELARRGVRRVALVDVSEQVETAAEEVNRGAGRDVAVPYRGDVTLEAFRTHVFSELCRETGTVVSI